MTPDRLGPYEILGKLGEGGMGEVYRATDTKLKRQVAIKILPASLATDADRLARFQREAEVLASLNHPNIAHIYGLEGQAGPDGQEQIHALVMELVEGEDLAGRIARLRARGTSARQVGMPIDEALPIAKQIAEALEAAHEQGIVHRDLKPANIKVRPDGTVKVLDFGLAKALDQGSGFRDQGSGTASMSPTITTPAMTQAGMILGTAAYMAPEQARGKVVDKRADVWAFGAVLYEMLAGTRAFEGEDVADTLGNVMKMEPDWTRCPSSTPPRVVQVMRACLQKNLKQRIDSAHDVRLALEGVFESAASHAAAPAASSSRHARLAWLVAAAAVMGMIALVAPALRHLRETPPAEQSYRFDIAPPGGSRFTMFRLSPDGRYVAYVASGQGLWIRPLDSLESHQIPGSEGASYPFWSPDSAFVGFFQAGKLKKVAVTGGPAQTLCDVTDARGGAWAPDGTILFTDGVARPIFRVPSSGGKPAVVTELINGDPGEGHRWPEFLPDGKHFLISATANNREHAGLLIASLDGSAPVRLSTDDSDAVFSQGHLFFLRDLTLMALPFDPVGLKVTGEAFPIAEGVGIAANVRYGAFSVAANGTLAYWRGAAVNTRELVWLDRAGKRLNALGEPATFSGPLALSPDEKTVAVTIGGSASPPDVWLLDSASGLRNKFTFSAGRYPVWSPDGRTVVYGRPTGFTYDVVRKPVAGGAEEVLLGHIPNASPSDVSPDGKTIAHHMSVANLASEIGLLAADGDHKDLTFASSPANERQARFSPDGKWIVYESDESGQVQVYVQAIAAGGGKFQISTSGGSDPAWSHDGKELYYLDAGGKLVAVPVKMDGASFQPSAPQALFTAPGASGFAVAHDGQRFLMNIPAGGAAAAAGPPLTVVTNWQSGLKK